MKYYLVYLLSFILIFSLFMFNSSPKSIHDEIYQMEDYLMLEEETLSQRTDTLIVIPRVIEPNNPIREYQLESQLENQLDNNNKGFDFGSILDNINGLITMVIGMINIMTFWFQMRDRKRANQNNSPIEE